jgi:hypothetical protein
MQLILSRCEMAVVESGATDVSAAKWDLNWRPRANSGFRIKKQIANQKSELKF